MANETPQERNRRVRAQLEITFSNSGARIIRGSNPLGFLGELFDTVAVLQYIGASQKIREGIEAVKQAASVNRKCPMLPQEERTLNGERFDALLKRLLYLERAARHAEEKLERAGGRFNLKTEKLELITGGRYAELLTRCIQALSVEYGTDAPGREKIKNYLSNIFNDELDAGPHGKINRALEKLREPSKR
jgi:hypothetical protein